MVNILEEVRVPVRAEIDVVLARQQGRKMAAESGFSIIDQVATATAVSELARNIYQYAAPGEIVLRRIQQGGRYGIMVIAHDEGPGIADVDRALQGGYSTGGGLGLGLSGTRRLMDEFEIASQLGKGTTVTATKWKR